MYRVSKVLNNNGVIAIDMEENLLALVRKSASVLINLQSVPCIGWSRRRSVDLRKNW